MWYEEMGAGNFPDVHGGSVGRRMTNIVGVDFVHVSSGQASCGHQRGND